MGILVGGGSAGSSQQSDWAFRSSGGLLSILALVAVVIFAFSGNYPRGLFDLLMGLNRWVYRVYAYMMLMTDEYPPVPAGQRRRGSDDRAGFAGGATRLTLILRPQIEGHGDDRRQRAIIAKMRKVAATATELLIHENARHEP